MVDPCNYCVKGSKYLDSYVPPPTTGALGGPLGGYKHMADDLHVGFGGWVMLICVALIWIGWKGRGR